MRSLTNRPTFWLVTGLSLGTVALAAAATDSTVLGWTPLVSLYGRGDASAAVRSIKSVTDAYDAVLHRSDIDKPTQKFIDDSFDELEDFDLEAFHELLPEERGGYRELSVRGDLKGNRYLVQRASVGSGFEVSVSGRRELADMSISLRAKPHATLDKTKTYLIGARFGLGIGALSWRGLTDAGMDGLRLASTGDPRSGATDQPAPSSEARARVKALHPGLGEEDVQVLALLDEAFPALSKVLGGVGRVDDVRVAQPPGGTYQHVTLRTRVMPERLEKNYDDFAEHLADLKDLATADIRWFDAQGRTIMNLKLNTRKLSLALECYVKDGRLLPFRGTQVFADEPLDPMGDALKATRLVVDARLEMLGVVIFLDKLRVNLGYSAQEGSGSIDARLTSVPGVRVEGAALGLVPTGLVDVFIPGNIEGLTRQFFEVAVKGNDKKGIVLHADVGSPAVGEKGVLTGSLDIEAIDSFLVKMGVGIVNDRVIPDDDAVSDSEKLAGALHDAFVRDLKRFQGRVGG
jgi:hypothetical protein